MAVVIPAYNEEKRIGKTLEFYGDYFERKRLEKEIDYEILVVINNTKDRTEEIVRKYSTKNNRVKYLNFKTGGKGFAVVEGFRDSLKRENDLIGFVDADMATSPEEFYKLVKNIGRFDGIIASRYVEGANIMPRPSLQRLLAKRVFNTLVRALLFIPFRDTQCGAKVFRRKTVEKIISEVKMSQWAFDVDLLFAMHRKGLKIKEFPTRWEDKEYSKINFWKAGPKMALGVIRLRLLNSPLRKFINLYDKIF